MKKEIIARLLKIAHELDEEGDIGNADELMDAADQLSGESDIYDGFQDNDFSDGESIDNNQDQSQDALNHFIKQLQQGGAHVIDNNISDIDSDMFENNHNFGDFEDKKYNKFHDNSFKQSPKTYNHNRTEHEFRDF